MIIVFKDLLYAKTYRSRIGSRLNHSNCLDSIHTEAPLSFLYFSAIE